MIEGATSSDLDLIGIKRDLHGKAISCEATNEVGSSQQSYTLTIECKYNHDFMWSNQSDGELPAELHPQH